MLFVVLMGVIYPSCKPLKNIDLQKVGYTILLEKGSDSSYIQERYEPYNITTLRKSSRSQNQYSVIFNLSPEQINKLEQAFAEDENFVKYSKNEVKDENVQNSKNIE